MSLKKLILRTSGVLVLPFLRQPADSLWQCSWWGMERPCQPRCPPPYSPPVLPASVSVRCSAHACNVLARGPDLSCRVLFPPLCVYVFHAGLPLTRRRVFR